MKSSAIKLGKYVTQAVVFLSGEKKTFHGIDTATIEQGEFTKFMLRDGRMVMINTKNVIYVEVFGEEE